MAYGWSPSRSTVSSINHSLPASPNHLVQKGVASRLGNESVVCNRVLVGEDATKDPSEVCLVWALNNLIKPGDSVTVMGILHQITTPMGYKSQANLSDFVGTNRSALEAEISQKLAQFENKFGHLAEYCDRQGVYLDITISAGTPMKAVLIREAVKLKATHVLLDRNLRRDRKYYQEHLECSVVTISSKNQVEHIRESSFTHMLETSELPPWLKSPAFTTPVSTATSSTFDHNSISTTDTSNHRGSRASTQTLMPISEDSSCMGAHCADSVDGSRFEDLCDFVLESESRRSMSSSASDCSFIDLFMSNSPDGVMPVWSCVNGNEVDNTSRRPSSIDQAASKGEIISSVTNPMDLDSATFSSPPSRVLQKSVIPVHPGRDTPKLSDFIHGTKSDVMHRAVDKLGESHLSKAPDVEKPVLDLQSEVKENRLLNKSITQMKKNHVWGKTLPQAPPLCSICKLTSMELGRSSKVYDWLELQAATNDFAADNLIAEGGFSFAYKGILPEGHRVTIKKLKPSSLVKDVQLSTEVDALSSAQHRNLVRLLGYGVKDGEYALVYEYVCNGSLDQHLSGKIGLVLEWSSRYKIALGVARGLRYLHEECRVGCIVHQDMRANNILLTHDFVPLVGDFGLAKLNASVGANFKSQVHGAQGVLAPEYVENGQATLKSDVYSFGVVLLELITGRRAIDSPALEGEVSLMEWIIRILEAGLYGSWPESLDDIFPATNSMTLACNSQTMSEGIKQPPQMDGLQMLHGTSRRVSAAPRGWRSWVRT